MTTGPLPTRLGPRLVLPLGVRAVWLLLALAWGPAWAAERVEAEVAGTDAAVERGREALQGRTRFPWYDAERDALRRIDVQPPADTAENRRSNWQADASLPDATGPSFGTDWSGLWAVIEALIWLGLLGLLIWLIYFLARSYLRQHSPPEAEEAAAEDVRSQADLIETLPFDVQRPQSDLLAEARRLYELGAYAQAILYLFSYQLIRLDRGQHIRLARGKTNRQYLRELQPRPDLRGILERTMLVFEEVFFGHYPLDRAGFERCWERLDEFHQRLSEAAL
jgi:hypothetical protein